MPLEFGIGRSRTAEWGTALHAPAQWDVVTVLTRTLLERVEKALLNPQSNVLSVMAELVGGLSDIRASSTPEAWAAATAQCKAHPLLATIHQDPFTSRTFNKPRGYAGDAVMIDYIYTRNCRQSATDTVTPLGEQMFEFNINSPACAGVRARRDFVVTVLDEMCEQIDKPRILSVACGHLREAGLSQAIKNGMSGEIVALDADALSLEVVAQAKYAPDVTTICNSIKALFRGSIAREKFDFIYSTGLYDYLDERLATRLTHRMFEMLNPGGRLLVANFLPDIWCAGYMETFMDWQLIYRDTAQMQALASTIPSNEIRSSRTFTESHENIVFLELNKA
jgi:SAM-dependent methyltransferase